ncbi:MAG: glycosyltransferase family 2 protein, partial [Pseudobutyrivibrio sp.]|nr:glycosyltransferase family 2 protein [Pseudobutyrivibrio sp.]
MKVLFGTVVYPGAFKYMEDFFDSLEHQTYKDFRLLLISDGVATSDINNVVTKHNIAVDIVVADEGKTPAKLRVQLLSEAKSRDADVLVLGDIDDTFSENRVAKVIETFKANTELGFVYNDLLLPDKTVIM